MLLLFVLWYGYVLVKLQAVVAVVVVVANVLFSKETKFEVDTTSIILSYLCHFRNVTKNYLDTINLQHTKPCKQNATKLIKVSSKFPLWKTLEGSVT